MSKKILVTTPIYYPSAEPHIGSAYCTWAAEIYARWMRQKGFEVVFSTGTDNHGAKIAELAEKVGETPFEFSKKLSAKFKKCWGDLNIDFDDYIETTEGRHAENVDNLIKLIQKHSPDAFFDGEYSGNYCVGCEKFLLEKDLNEKGECPDHKRAPEKIVEKNKFFRLSAFAGSLKKYLESGVVFPDFRKNEAMNFIMEGLEDMSITRENVDWGLKFPVSGETIYVWFDALPNYLTVAESHGGWDDFEVVHFLGKEIARFHVLLWPAMLEAAGLHKPDKFCVTGFLNDADGQKFSKSLGNGVDPLKMVEKYGRDAVVFYLFGELNLGQDGNFSEENLLARKEKILAADWGNFVSRVATLAGRVENWQKAELNAEAREICEKARCDFDEKMENFEYKKAIEAAWAVMGWANAFIDREKPWENGENAAGCVRTCVEIMRVFADLMSPFLKDSEDFVKKSLNLKNLAGGWGEIEVGNVEKVGVMYPR